MTELPVARAIRRPPLSGMCSDLITLAHHERLLRRRRLVTVHDEGFLVDLPTLARVEHRDAFELEDGRLIEVVAAEESLMEARGPDLARLAWHVGNRHAPCQIEGDRLLVLRDKVMRTMLEGLGATVRDVSEPFHPEGGAYGEGTPMGHSHGEHTHEPDPLRGLSGLGSF
jgi:urease accessory protein